MADPSDHEWLLARERGEDVAQVPADRRARYAELEDLIAALPGQSPSPAWKRRVLDALDPAPARPARVAPVRRRRSVVTGALLAAAAAVVVVIALRGRQAGRPAADIVATAEVQRAEGLHRGDQVTAGDTWLVRIDAGQAVELRVYGDAGEPLASCPGNRDCAVTIAGSRRSYSLRMPLSVRGDVRAVVFSAAVMPPPQSLDLDLAAAQRLGLEARQVAVVSVH